MTTEVRPDALLDRLAGLRRDLLDDTTAARTLAHVEAAFAPPVSRPSRRWRRIWVPAALAAWAVLYLWGAVDQLGRVFPSAPVQRREVAALFGAAEVALKAP